MMNVVVGQKNLPVMQPYMPATLALGALGIGENEMLASSHATGSYKTLEGMCMLVCRQTQFLNLMSPSPCTHRASDKLPARQTAVHVHLPCGTHEGTGPQAAAQTLDGATSASTRSRCSCFVATSPRPSSDSVAGTGLHGWGAWHTSL